NGGPQSVSLTSDSSGGLELTGLASGTYSNIVVTETATGCTDNLGQAVLTSPGLNASVSITYPLSCNTNDGGITISGLINGLTYTLSYNFQLNIISEIYIADNNGEIIIDDLVSGVYENIHILENHTGCTASLNTIELICSITQIDCFKIRAFFTPNNDGYNDYWNLEPVSSLLQCDYILYIYD